jgi:hypothetical protein
MAAWLRLPKVSDSGFGTGLAKLIAIDREHLSQTQAPDADEPVATRRRTVTHAGLRAACRSAAGRATGARDRLAAMCAATALRAGLERTPWFARIWTPAMRSDDARFRLPLAEMLDVRHDVLGRQEGFARTDLRLRHGLRTDVWQQDQNYTHESR